MLMGVGETEICGHDWNRKQQSTSPENTIFDPNLPLASGLFNPYLSIQIIFLIFFSPRSVKKEKTLDILISVLAMKFCDVQEWMNTSGILNAPFQESNPHHLFKARNFHL